MAHLDLTREGVVAWIVFRDLPGGCMDRAVVEELDGAVSAVENDEGVRALVITGAMDGIFVRHYSLKELSAGAETLAARGLAFDPARPTPEQPIHAIFRRLEALKVPVIAAINGFCMGGGFELALACDIRIAAAGDYAIGLPEVNVGLLPGAGGTQRLPRLVGEGRALELMLLGRVVQPDEALRLGLVSEIASDVRARAAELAAMLAAKPPLAVAHIKRLTRGAVSRPLSEGLAVERTLFCDVMIQPEARRLMKEAASGRRDIRDTQR